MGAYEETTCPKCKSPMVSRKGPDGRRFWACSQFPYCDGTRNTDGDAKRQEDPEEDDEDGLPSEQLQKREKSRWRSE